MNLKQLSPKKCINTVKNARNPMATKQEVRWSPIENRFVTWTFDTLCLYDSKPIADCHQNAIRISNRHGAELIGNVNIQNNLKCVDIHPKCDNNDLLFALGLSNGTIKLATFSQLDWEPKPTPAKELVPKNPRQCNTVVFNPVENNLLASGLDKYKPDNCIAIWDINHISNANNAARFDPKATPPADLPKPLWEYGQSEHCVSIDWFHNNSKVLVAGMNLKHVKLIDIRETPRLISQTLTKAALGVHTNPSDDKYLATFYDNQILIWDTRHMEKHVHMLYQQKQIAKIGWSHTRPNILTCLLKESNILNLYDIDHPIADPAAVMPLLMERIVNPNSPYFLNSFSWHPTDKNRILSVGASDKNIMIDSQVHDKVIIGCTPASDVVWSSGNKVLQSINTNSAAELQDISSKMMDRAKSQYGLAEELYKNADAVKNDEVLSNVWNWLHLSMKLVEDDKLSIPGVMYKHPGVLSVLNIDPEKNPSEMVSVTWTELGHTNCGGTMKYYKHEDRDKALLLCSWPIDRNAELLNTVVGNLERAGAYTRAAALAVFNLNVQLAIDILSRAPEHYGPSLNIVAMALSGFSDDPNSVWKKFCSSTIGTLTDPYLKAMFGFLTADGNYESLLSESNIAVDDRVALACIYLSDVKLMEYVKKLIQELRDQGNLDGLLLTGNSPQGLKLIGKYLDMTGDIQSAALLAVKAFSNEINTTTVQNWVLNYQALLNKWKLWFERAHFDIMTVKLKKEKPLPQIFVSCAYCGKNISSHLRSLKTQQYSRINMTGSSNKLTACPHCRKPLPRCTICLMNMGGSVEDSEKDRIAGFDSSFTWCQSCRHGGHAKHLLQWFDEHLECPQVGCACRCNSLDPITTKN
ncbi:GATOR complex protein mio isoform X2 [Rhynchophorus ferrugineus]|uniref:GATOR complex protein mio isoform X2 n=1 Tax=Rhynchophorus ferrugineus TaxID=354439 RepID=UPI003FCE1830